MMPTIDTSKDYSPQEAAECLSVTLDAVYTWRQRRQLKVVKVGGRLRIPGSELAKMVSFG